MALKMQIISTRLRILISVSLHNAIRCTRKYDQIGSNDSPQDDFLITSLVAVALKNNEWIYRKNTRLLPVDTM